jgi:hypothetical protein
MLHNSHVSQRMACTLSFQLLACTSNQTSQSTLRNTHKVLWNGPILSRISYTKSLMSRDSKHDTNMASSILQAQSASTLSCTCIYTYRLHMLGVVFPVVISDLLEHLVDASLTQCFLFATLDAGHVGSLE